MPKKKKPQPTAKILILLDGTELPIDREDGKYYHCANRSFRRMNPNIAQVRDAFEPAIATEEHTEGVFDNG